MKVAIVGSRDFDWSNISINGQELEGYTNNNYHTKGMRDMIKSLVLAMTTTDYAVSGGADGADYWGDAYASQLRRSRIIHEADWERYGKRAGPIRNALIARDADIMFAFYTDRTTSRGTNNCVSQAKKKGIPVFEFDSKKNEWFWTSKTASGGFSGASIDFEDVLRNHRVIESSERPDSGG